jgi:3-methyladenine DNA glycosylase AlkC
MRLGRIQRQCRRCLIVHDDAATMDQLRQWVWARRVLLERLPIRALCSIGAKRVKRPVGHRLYAESEDAGCMVGLQAAELPSVDETAITDTLLHRRSQRTARVVSSTGFRLVIIFLTDNHAHRWR